MPITRTSYNYFRGHRPHWLVRELFKRLLKRVLRKPRRPSNFSLGDRGKPGIPGGGEDVVNGSLQEKPPYASPDAKRAQRRIWRFEKSIPSGVTPRSVAPARTTSFGGMPEDERQLLGTTIHKSLDKSVKVILDTFHAPRNSDLVARTFEVRCNSGVVRAALFYIQGLSDNDSLRINVLRPLMQLRFSKEPTRLSIEDIRRRIVNETQVRTGTLYAHAVSALTIGEAVLLLDGDASVLIMDTRLAEHRAIAESPAEAVVRGPHTGLVENLRANVSLIRGHLRTPNLVSEIHFIGAQSRTEVALMYLEGVVNPKLVDEARRRLSSISTDIIAANGELEGYFVEQTWNPFPTLVATERPDKVASMLAEGHIALVNSSPAALLAPATIWDFMHSPEDNYIHFVAASALRLVRWASLFVTIYASALYIAIATFHPEIIPTELLFAIAAARERVPLPTALEVALMEAAFELIREAGIRIPTIVGSTLGIVGAVVIGQAAVQASVVSPILVVIVAISNLGSFAITSYDLGLFARLVRWVMIGAASTLGILGLTFASMAVLAVIMDLRSFGVPVTAPLLPWWKHSRDLFFKGPTRSMTSRPGQVRPVDDKKRQVKPDGGKM